MQIRGLNALSSSGDMAAKRLKPERSQDDASRDLNYLDEFAMWGSIHARHVPSVGIDARRSSDRIALALFAPTIGLSAFLLFSVQPLIAKYILPWFGGAPAVWNVALVFFQVFLFTGYAYAHWSVKRLSPRGQASLQVTLLLAAAALLPITPAATWKPIGAGDPTGRILLVLATSVGLPYLLLASTSPLLQAWFGRMAAGRSPYRLFALSNAGSLLALLSYPFAIEPVLGRGLQARAWSYCFGLYALGFAACALRMWLFSSREIAAAPLPAARPERAVGTRRKRRALHRERAAAARRSEAASPAGFVRFLWLALPAAASALLLAVTNHLSRDLPVTPVLWVLPLALYLLSFVIVFAGEGGYRRTPVAVTLIPALGATLAVLFAGMQYSIELQIGVLATTLFLACMACHGELARLKPDPSGLTAYYLTIAGGGALGGASVALVAPRVFTLYLELHVALWLCAALLLLASLHGRARGRRRLLPLALGLALLGFGAGLAHHAHKGSRLSVTASRNFHGVLSVHRSYPNTERDVMVLANGATTHGLQFLAPGRRRLATAYFSTESGAGLVFRYYQSRGQRNVGIVGLGIGTLATYAQPGDRFRFYEIDPDVVDIARTYFSYLDDSPARVEVVLGDARLSLEREAPQGFDILLLDAFSSHAVPTHLLTREAFEIYARHLKPDGVIAVHVSNPYADLKPVVRAAAQQLGMRAAHVANAEGPRGFWESNWMLLTRSDDFLRTDFIRRAKKPGRQSPLLWTDDYANLLGVLKLRGD